ncbi:MAG: prepilin-type N-terminal cleavage/methylation domain-containing protein [Cyanobacteria bacterium P01_H01_bin.119]
MNLKTLLTKRSYPVQSETGFTLIEMLVVVIIIAVLAGIAAPGWLAFMDRQRMNSVRSDLFQTIKRIQTDAQQNRASRTIIVDTTASIPTVRVAPDPTNIANSDVIQLGNGNINENYLQLSTLASTPGGWSSTVTTVTFNYEGVVDVDNSEVPFVISVSPTSGSAQRCVVVSNLLGGLKNFEGDECDNPALN